MEVVNVYSRVVRLISTADVDSLELSGRIFHHYWRLVSEVSAVKDYYSFVSNNLVTIGRNEIVVDEGIEDLFLVHSLIRRSLQIRVGG